MLTKKRNHGQIRPQNAAFKRPKIQKLSLSELDSVLTRIANTFAVKLKLNHRPIVDFQFSSDDLFEAAYNFATAETQFAKRQALSALTKMGFRTSRVVELPKPSHTK